MPHGASQIEIAFDEGRIVDGTQSLPVCELELELKQVSLEDAVNLPRQGCAIHGLCLSTISKSTKGQRLAGAAAHSASGARAFDFRRRAGGYELVSAVVVTCLKQVLEFASDVAGGSSDADHIRQVRVGSGGCARRYGNWPT